ncbi:MAG: hypothetical protein H6907_21500 [Hyphomicrobiales bacterium]|nr:hypothetical protein [Hyphomicrobiales bacterium]MCP5374320.1 hypothetical protein [Hyphomicrobiales bacterium]
MSTFTLARRRHQPKISLHADLKGLFFLCLFAITAASAAVTTAVQPAWLFRWSDMTDRFAPPAAAPDRPAVPLLARQVRLGMDESELRTHFPGARTLRGRDGIRVVTFEADGGARHVVWFRADAGAHRIKVMGHYLAGTERQLLSLLDASFGQPASGGCAQGSGGCAFTWHPGDGRQVDAAFAPLDQDPTHFRLSLSIGESPQ